MPLPHLFRESITPIKIELFREDIKVGGFYRHRTSHRNNSNYSAKEKYLCQEGSQHSEVSRHKTLNISTCDICKHKRTQQFILVSVKTTAWNRILMSTVLLLLYLVRSGVSDMCFGPVDHGHCH